MKKRCSACGETKPVADFWKHKSKKDGYQSDCKACSGTMKRVSRGLPVDKGTMQNSYWGLEKTEGYVKVKVRCWNHKEGCNATRDTTIAEGDSIPRYVCDDCKDVGYIRGGRKNEFASLGRVAVSVPKEDPRTAGVIILTPKSKGFAAVAATITHISKVKFSGEKFIDKGWK